ncbi:zinc-dependent alcohol dehydrogenase [Actinomadura mexicana]|uniref:L-iditol 2-dehydrogenase n=1 Tax=Actinomadura mexicana TaxID=134959 RepID=A0A238XFA4_9ACTN|nr:alcohol dehydrogenase catalytic domain-containing protein [Actinomadura mexicana]SNR57231.1 L-iditol 2-dehydrogenase [Actinomadura mexicana]
MIGIAKTGEGPGHVNLVERPDPHPGSGQVLLEVHGAGVCGTDLHIAAGEYPANPPMIMGHEVSGVVTATGDGVDPAWIGRRVVSETFSSTCGTCPRCREGRPNLCAGRRSIGTHVDGAFAERIILPAINLHTVPDGLDEHAAALAEPLACVCQCMLEPAAVGPGDRVLVVGPGPMGVLAAQVAAVLGGDVLVAGLPSDADRLAVVRSLALTATTERVGATGFDVVVDASGSSGGITACLEAVRPGGRFVQLGIVGGPVTTPLDLVLIKELEVRTGFASTPRAWRRALALVGRGEVRLEPLVSAVVPLTAWKAVFEDLRAGRDMKVVFDPRRG